MESHYCIFLLSHYFWIEQFVTFDNWCDVLRAAFCDCRNVFVERLRDFFVERLRDFVHREVPWFLFVCRGCMIFLAHSGFMIYFCRGCVIIFAERLPDFCVWIGCVIFVCGEVAWFFHSLTHSGCMIYFCGGCMIFFCVERLHDFVVERLCDTTHYYHFSIKNPLIDWLIDISLLTFLALLSHQ